MRRTFVPFLSPFAFLLAASGCSLDATGSAPGGDFQVEAGADTTLGGGDVNEIPEDSAVATDSGAAGDSAPTLDSGVVDVDSSIADSGVVATDSGPADSGIVAIDSGPQDTGVADSVIDTGPADTGIPCTEANAVVAPFNGHCYWPLTNISWTAAETACGGATTNSHLVAITSDQEETFVEGISSADRWIGLSKKATDPAMSASYEWTTGEPTTYQHWDTANHEPNGSGNCVRLEQTGFWADNPCDTRYTAICERE